MCNPKWNDGYIRGSCINTELHKYEWLHQYEGTYTILEHGKLNLNKGRLFGQVHILTYLCMYLLWLQYAAYLPATELGRLKDDGTLCINDHDQEMDRRLPNPNYPMISCGWRGNPIIQHFPLSSPHGRGNRNVRTKTRPKKNAIYPTSI